MRSLAFLLLVVPALAVAQAPAPPPPPPTPPPSPPPPPPPAAAPSASDTHASAGNTASKSQSGIAFEFAIGPANFIDQRTSGLAWSAGLRFLKHKGLRTDFGIEFQQTSFDQHLTLTHVDVHNAQTSNGGNLELLLGFGLGPVEILGGGGLGVTWVSSKLDLLGQSRTIDRNAVGVGSYGLEVGVHIEQVPWIHPVFRLWRLGDLGDIGTNAQTGTVDSLLFLFGLGLEVPT